MAFPKESTSPVSRRQTDGAEDLPKTSWEKRDCGIPMSVTIGTVPDGMVTVPCCKAVDTLEVREMFWPPPVSKANVCV